MFLRACLNQSTVQEKLFYQCLKSKMMLNFYTSVDFEKKDKEHNEEILYYTKNEEEAFVEIFWTKNKDYFSSFFENLIHEHSLILLLSLKDPDILKQN